MTSKALKLRPYARLLTMLGDQLIKNERIALIEIIKNSYDADASWVKVTFEGFTSDFAMTPSSTIVIEDDGVGMSRDIVENHWLNPATPVKWIGKQKKPKTAKGRTIQGEKGIGRFALLKLGRSISMTTRSKGDADELTVSLDLSKYDENFIPEDGKPLFLDDLTVRLEDTDPAEVIRGGHISLGARTITRARHGTRIEISNLSGSWSRSRVEKVFLDVARLQSMFDVAPDDRPAEPDFEVAIYRGDEFEPLSTDYRERLRELTTKNAVLRIENGQFDNDSQQFSFELNGRSTTLKLDDPDITGLGVFRRYEKNSNLLGRGLQCGPFSFAFFAFDFSADAKGRFALDANDRELIKGHRIYLYRDGIRVYPYGDPDDDWLQIDVARGTIRASEFLSNDQVVGFVNITQARNPELTDKTSREGLIDKGYATSDFIFLLQLVLAWIRRKPYSQYRLKQATANEVEVFKKEQVQGALDRAIVAAADSDPKLRSAIAEAAGFYKTERRYLVQRAETTEHLAGVGLSVETASHDLMLAMQRALAAIDTLIVQTRKRGQLDKDYVDRELTMVRGALSFIQAQMKDLQLLFKSTKQRRKDIRVSEIVQKVQRLYQTALDRENVSVQIDESGGPLVAKTTDAVLLQVLLNLFDNSLYWLQGVPKARKIAIQMNGAEGTLVFADNGPGIKSDDAPYIFEPFYSGKGEDGRGLGLYIARQLLERHEYSIALADLKAHRPLGGASFVVSFVREDS